MNQSFCPAPWLSFYIDPSGNVENCCVSRNNLGNIDRGDDLQEIIFYGKNQDIQRSMLQGERLEGCKWCYDKSHSLQNRFFQIFPAREDPLYQQGKFELRYLDLRWSNVCNYACIYCGPELSSTWAAEMNSVHRIEKPTKQHLLKYVLDNIGTIKELYLAGGEPTMMKENEIVLQALAEKNPNCHVCVNTNLSVTKNNRVHDLLKKLPNCQWLISVEGTGKQYEYIRYPGVWETFDDNLRDLELSQPNGISFNMVFMSLNALSIWDLVDDLLDRGYQHDITLALYNNGNWPGPWDLRHMPVDYQQRVLDRMADPKYHGLIGYQNIKDYLEQKIFLQSDQPWQSMEELDRRRGLDSRSIFPVMYEYKDRK